MRWRLLMAKMSRMACGLVALVLLVGGVKVLAVHAWDWVDLYQFFTSPVLREVPFRKEEAQKIVTGVRNGTLSADRTGRIILPPSLASTTKDGKVYVTHKENGLLLILFPTWQGKGANMHGYLFSSRPLTETEKKQGVIYLAYLAQPYANPKPDPPMGVILEREVSTNWYYVSYSGS
jgi:hypothetical protein